MAELTDAELDAEEAKLNTQIAEYAESLRAAKTRLHELGQARLVLHKAEHQASYEAKRAEVQILVTEIKGLIASSSVPADLVAAARKVGDAGYTLSDIFHKANAGDTSNWDSPAYRAMSELHASAESASRTAYAVANYLSAAEGSEGERKKLFTDTANSIRRNGTDRDEGGLPCTNCGEPKWGYNDETYDCRNCW